MTTSSLPYVDEHATAVAAPVDAVWEALLRVVDEGFAGAVGGGYARLVGCRDVTPSGPRPLTEGSVVVGFHVARALPGRELALEGRHRFSTYALVFRLTEAGPGQAELRAETRAAFPGVSGRAYRLLVIESGAHVVAVRRLLAAVRRRAGAAA